MLALANVERAHDEAVATCQTTRASMLIREPSRQLVISEPTSVQVQEEPESRDEATEMAKLAAHRQAAMKIVAQHMYQQMAAANARHERVMSQLKEQREDLAQREDARNIAAVYVIESKIKAAERVNAELLESLEQKVRRDIPWRAYACPALHATPRRRSPWHFC